MEERVRKTENITILMNHILLRFLEMRASGDRNLE
jgi:hypothetical protein